MPTERETIIMKAGYAYLARVGISDTSNAREIPILGLHSAIEEALEQRFGESPTGRSGESREPDPDTGLIHAMAALAESDAHDTEEQALGEAIRHVEELLPPGITVIIESGSSRLMIDDWDAEFDISDEDDQRRGEIIMSAHDLAERKTR